MAIVVLEIPNWHPATLNQLLAGRYRSAKLKRRDRVLVITMARLKDLPTAAGKRRVTLTVTLAKGQRSPDTDAYWKSLLDALTKAKLIKSDHPKWVELAPLIPERSKDAKIRTIITLEDI